MLYRLLVKAGQTWVAPGLDYTSLEEAKEAAWSNWPGLPFIIIPVDA